MGWLVALDGAFLGRRYSLRTPCLIGRSPYNHVVLDDARISRQHAKVAPEAGGYVVYDFNSGNGTYVNDELVARRQLTPQDTLRFGPYTFRFEPDSGEELAVPHKRLEELTRLGLEPPSQILNSRVPLSPIPALASLAELEDAERKLRTLYGFMQSISTSLDMAEIADRTVHSLLDVFPHAELAAIYLIDRVSGRLLPCQSRRRDGQIAEPAPLAEQFHEEVVRRRRAVMSAPLSLARPDHEGKKDALAMHAPILCGEELQGVLHVRVASWVDGGFSKGDLDLLTGIAAQAALALRSARLHQESLAQVRLQQDLRVAEQIQKSFLPGDLPRLPGLEFCTEYRPAYSVGGDFYDVFRLGPHLLGLFIGDVAGKGVAAALMMARVSSDLRAAALAEADPAHALLRVNRAMVERAQHETFVTVIYITLDLRTGQLVLANAGHPPPLLRRQDGRVERIEVGANMPIGVDTAPSFEQAELQLTPGEVLVLCTDGVLEATDGAGCQLGIERVEAAIARAPERAPAIAAAVLDEVRAHVASAPQYDDLTLLVMAMQARAPERDATPPTPTPAARS